MFERFTEKARQVLVEAQSECARAGDTSISTLHFLHALASVEGMAQRILGDRGVDRDVLRAAFPLRDPPPLAVLGPPFSPATKKLLELALREALQLGHNYIGTEHLLLAILRGDAVLRGWLEGHGVSREVVLRELPRGSRHERRLRDRLVARVRGDEQAGDRPADDSGRLLVALAEEEGTARDALADLGVDPAALRAAVDRVAAERAGRTDRVVLDLGVGLTLGAEGAPADRLRTRLAPLAERRLVGRVDHEGAERYDVPALADTVLPSVEAWLDALGEAEA